MQSIEGRAGRDREQERSEGRHKKKTDWKQVEGRNAERQCQRAGRAECRQRRKQYRRLCMKGQTEKRENEKRGERTYCRRSLKQKGTESW